MHHTDIAPDWGHLAWPSLLPCARLQLATDQRMTLPTGATVVAPPGAVFDLRNTGAAPTQMLDLDWITASTSTERDGALCRRDRSGLSQDIEAPVRVMVRQATAAPGATLTAPSDAHTEQSDNIPNPTRLPNLQVTPDGARFLVRLAQEAKDAVRRCVRNCPVGVRLTSFR